MAKIKYHVKAHLHAGSHKDEMKHKQVLILNELPAQQQFEIKQVSENNITTWCCVNQGTSKLEVIFDKNTFFPTENCRAKVEIDQSRCNVRLTSLRLAIEQEVEIRIGMHSYRDVITLTEQNQDGVNANNS